MTNFNLSDFDDKALTNMFDIVKTNLVKKLENKILQLNEFKSSDCCSITASNLDKLKRDGHVEWNQLTGITNRLVARRKQKELESNLAEIDLDEDLTQMPDSGRGDGKGAGGKLRS